MLEKLKEDRIWAVGYVAVVVGLIVSFYTDAQQDDRQAQSDARVTAAEAKAAKAATACIKKVIQVSTEATAARAAATEDRDAALLGSKKALRELIRLRVIEQIGDSTAVRQAADQYMVQTEKFVKASEMLSKARNENPLPDPEKIC